MLLECGRVLARAEVIHCIILPSRNGKHYDSVVLYLDVSRLHLVRDCCGRSWEFVWICGDLDWAAAQNVPIDPVLCRICRGDLPPDQIDIQAVGITWILHAMHLESGWGMGIWVSVEGRDAIFASSCEEGALCSASHSCYIVLCWHHVINPSLKHSGCRRTI